MYASGEVIETAGGDAPIVNETGADVVVLPAPSVAIALTVCAVPGASDETSSVDE